MIALKFESVTKAYHLHKHNVSVGTLVGMPKWPTGEEQLFYALKNVSFEIKKGEAFGIIGRNGAGKSTILKIISGITNQTSGNVVVNGLVSSLIELGAGFHPDLTGRENVYMNGAIMGISRKVIDRKFDEIVDFAELWDFIDVPVKKYSSGMYARLGFSVAVSVDPEILVIDEILSVGDIFFQQKCFKKMREIKAAGATFIFVTHDTVAMQNLCESALLLDAGKVEYLGNTIEAVSRYYGKSGIRKDGTTGAGIESPTAKPNKLASVRSAQNAREYQLLRKEIFDHNIIPHARNQEGPSGMEILAASFQDDRGEYSYRVEQMGVVTIMVVIRALQTIPLANAGFTLFDRLNNLIFSAGLIQKGRGIRNLATGIEKIIAFRVQLSVQVGEYTFALGCAESEDDDLNRGTTHHRLFGLGPIEIYPADDSLLPFHGMASLPIEMQIHG